MLDLQPDEAHVWYLFPEAVPPALEEQALALLTPDEAARHARFRLPEGRRDYALTRALVRTTLSRYSEVAPANWRFLAGPHGRPAIAAEMGVPLHFNLSHTKGLIACVVGLEPEIGIDVEAITSDRANLAIAARYFSAAEVAALADRPGLFFDLWTLKEAYLKARGLGVGLPLDQLSFELDERGVTVSFDPGLNDAAATWQFDRLFPSEQHRVATAIRRRSPTRIRIVERTVTTPADR